MPLSAN